MLGNPSVDRAFGDTPDWASGTSRRRFGGAYGRLAGPATGGLNGVGSDTLRKPW
jgi:hypothetical protein